MPRCSLRISDDTLSHARFLKLQLVHILPVEGLSRLFRIGENLATWKFVGQECKTWSLLVVLIATSLPAESLAARTEAGPSATDVFQSIPGQSPSDWKSDQHSDTALGC